MPEFPVGVSILSNVATSDYNTFGRGAVRLTALQVTSLQRGARRVAVGEPSRVDRTDGASRRGRCIRLLVVRAAPLQRTLDVRQPAEPTPRRSCRTL